jgi:hypothetical protein
VISETQLPAPAAPSLLKSLMWATVLVTAFSCALGGLYLRSEGPPGPAMTTQR